MICSKTLCKCSLNETEDLLLMISIALKRFLFEHKIFGLQRYTALKTAFKMSSVQNFFPGQSNDYTDVPELHIDFVIAWVAPSRALWIPKPEEQVVLLASRLRTGNDRALTCKLTAFSIGPRAKPSLNVYTLVSSLLLLQIASQNLFAWQQWFKITPFTPSAVQPTPLHVVLHLIFFWKVSGRRVSTSIEHLFGLLGHLMTLWKIQLTKLATETKKNSKHQESLTLGAILTTNTVIFKRQKDSFKPGTFEHCTYILRALLIFGGNVVTELHIDHWFFAMNLYLQSRKFCC